MGIEQRQKQPTTLGIVWWNTGLSPIGDKSKKSPKVELSRIVPIIAFLCEKADIVVLCEHIGDNSVSAINAYFSNKGIEKHFEGREINESEGRAGFKMTLLYNSTVLTLCELPVAQCRFLHTEDDLNPGHYRVGVLLRFKSSFLSEVLDIYAVHWSQHDERDTKSMKMSAASTLASKIRQSTTKYVVCMGDFNTEPYEDAMAALGASRSLSYAAKGKSRFYNPFWKFMPYVGTIMSSSDRAIKCDSPLFDQVLIGSGFLGGEFCHEVQIMGDDVYVPPDGEHRPIVVTLKRQRSDSDGKA